MIDALSAPKPIKFSRGILFSSKHLQIALKIPLAVASSILIKAKNLSQTFSIALS